VNVIVSVTRDGRTGRVVLNETTDAALERAMKRAEEIAAVLPADPEYVGALPPQKYLHIAGEDPGTATASAADRVPGVRAVIEPAAKENMNASGFFTNAGTVTCIANKAGNFGYHRATNASFSATARTADGTGSAGLRTRRSRSPTFRRPRSRLPRCARRASPPAPPG
jgi:predicted Zn-dependent protease